MPIGLERSTNQNRLLLIKHLLGMATKETIGWSCECLHSGLCAGPSDGWPLFLWGGCYKTWYGAFSHLKFVVNKSQVDEETAEVSLHLHPAVSIMVQQEAAYSSFSLVRCSHFPCSRALQFGQKYRGKLNLFTASMTAKFYKAILR